MPTVYSPDEEFHLKITNKEIGRYVLMCGDPARVEKIASYLDNPVYLKTNREYTIWNGMLEGEKVTVCSHGIGGPSTAIAVEELIHCGANTFIRIGTAGGMNPDVLGGDVVIATGAIRMEGTSREYAPIEFPAVADYDVVSCLIAGARDEHERYHAGVVHNKDSFYGQHGPQTMPVKDELISKWNAYIDCGTLASEMESAALFVLCSVRRARAGTVVQVLANQTRRALGMSDPVTLETDGAIRVGVAGLRRLIRLDHQAEK